MQHATTGLLILNVPIMYQETPVPNIVPVELTLLTLYWLGLPARTIQLHSWSPRYEEKFLMNSVKFISPLGHGDGCSVHIFFLNAMPMPTRKFDIKHLLELSRNDVDGAAGIGESVKNSFLQR